MTEESMLMRLWILRCAQNDKKWGTPQKDSRLRGNDKKGDRIPNTIFSSDLSGENTLSKYHTGDAQSQ